MQTHRTGYQCGWSFMNCLHMVALYTQKINVSYLAVAVDGLQSRSHYTFRVGATKDLEIIINS